MSTETFGFSPDHPELELDLEYPEATPPPEGWPVIIWLHGGGWRMQDRTARPDFSQHFAAAGFAMVSIDYSLAPSHPHPAQVQDLRQAIRFLRVHHEDLRLNSERIGLWGSSAGGHVAAMAALLGHLSELDSEHIPADFRGVSSHVSCVMEGYGPAEIEKLLPAFRSGEAGEAKPPTPEQDLLGGPATTPENYTLQLSQAQAASPVHQDATHAPPFLIMHGTGDTMVPETQSVALHSQLVHLGRQSTLILIEGFGHGFLNPGNVIELGPGVRLDNGRLEREPHTGFTAQQSPENPFELEGLAADHEMIKQFFNLHLG
ncbi:Esterase/lipase [Corynebacterium glutamicum]|uniref:alpha/beta hydrolase n=1 Tax=Corynebacterium glutamicum TaxID=1718 RepID=UPI00097ECE7B|nr:alpha/beta hydrolase [Corynebacterium glutamicum]SJM66622.1 Esterase/lipase [Corynebacterium glutamicum]